MERRLEELTGILDVKNTLLDDKQETIDTLKL